VRLLRNFEDAGLNSLEAYEDLACALVEFRNAADETVADITKLLLQFPQRSDEATKLIDACKWALKHERAGRATDVPGDVEGGSVAALGGGGAIARGAAVVARDESIIQDDDMMDVDERVLMPAEVAVHDGAEVEQESMPGSWRR
jgi:hypothetical protein